MAATASTAAANYRLASRRRGLFLSLLFASVLALVIVDLAMGPAQIGWAALWTYFTDPAAASATLHTIVWQLRLPQALMAVLVGAALGVAGAEMQTVLNNPLASPFTLGVSSAAALGAALSLALGWQLPGLAVAYGVPVNPFLLPLLCGPCLDLARHRLPLPHQGIVLRAF